MQLFAEDKLTAFAKRHARARKLLDAWRLDVQAAQWKTPQDLKNRYRSADFLSENRVILNLGGNHFRLVIKVQYQVGAVLVEWIGTHAEYSKTKF